MASFGERIKREREMRGISLEEIAESTKIGKRNLEALETEDFDKLPGGIFNKGFVRAYAKYLGLDEEQAVTDFLAAENAAASGIRLAADPEPAPVNGNNGDNGKKSRKERSKELESIAARREAEKKSNPPLNPSNTANRVWLAIAVICLIGGSVAWWKHSRAERSAPPVAQRKPAPVPVTVPPVATPSSAATTPAPENAVPDPTPQDDGLVHLKVHATQDSWIQVTVDGKTVQDGTLDANTDKSFSGKELTFKTGNAGGVELTYNNKTFAPFGKDNQVKQIKLKPEKKPAT